MLFWILPVNPELSLTLPLYIDAGPDPKWKNRTIFFKSILKTTGKRITGAGLVKYFEIILLDVSGNWNNARGALMRSPETS